MIWPKTIPANNSIIIVHAVYHLSVVWYNNIVGGVKTVTLTHVPGAPWSECPVEEKKRGILRRGVRVCLITFSIMMTQPWNKYQIKADSCSLHMTPKFRDWGKNWDPYLGYFDQRVIQFSWLWCTVYMLHIHCANMGNISTEKFRKSASEMLHCLSFTLTPFLCFYDQKN